VKAVRHQSKTKSYKENDRTYHLLCHHYHRLCGEPSVAVIEKILKRRSEKVYNEYIVKALLAKVVNIRDAGYELSVRSTQKV